MENTRLEYEPSTAVNVTVMPRHRRPREYLTEREIEKLIKAAGDNRWGASGRHSHPDRLPTRPASLRACFPALGRYRLPDRQAARTAF